MPKRTLYFPAFPANQFHGGSKRTKQISAIVEPENAKTVLLTRKYLTDSINAQDGLTVLRYIIRIDSKLSLKSRAGIAFSMLALSREIAREGRFDHAHIEFSCGVNRFMPAALKYQKIPYKLYTHNIEFLVPNGATDASQNQIDNFILEINALKNAEECITISDFDASVASIHCKNVRQLPYIPDAEEINKLTSVREARITGSLSSTNPVLIYGTMGNYPTAKGMIELYEYISLNPSVLQSRKVIIAGGGTQLHFKSSENINVLGAVSDEKLADLLKNCSAVIIKQSPTSGYLTKLTELNLCGVPVACNDDYIQARGLENVRRYSDFSELGSVLHAIFSDN